jgi:hypothetical protein
MKYFIERGSPSLVGRGIANPMFVRTRGFESHSPRVTTGFVYKLLYPCHNIEFL